ncbi:MAG: hypothetical protein ACOX2N_03995 [Peptococcia bacterium]|jgi:hypothetical protein
MKKKSKFVAFILSFLPGLSHVYVGFKERAVIFFGIFIGVIFLGLGMSVLTHNGNFSMLLVLALPLIWFVSMVDAVSLTEREQKGSINPGENSCPEHAGLIDEAWFNLNNKKLITIVLSIIPGAGHMYLGLQNRGFVLMSLFFFSAFLMGWLHLSLFLFILPVIWFYSMFDAFHRVQDEDWTGEKDELCVVSWCNEHPQWIGWGLILLGCLVIFERIISPLITWQIRSYVQTGLVALILIVGGIKLLVGSRAVSENEIITKEEQDV